MCVWSFGVEEGAAVRSSKGGLLECACAVLRGENKDIVPPSGPSMLAIPPWSMFSGRALFTLPLCIKAPPSITLQGSCAIPTFYLRIHTCVFFLR